MYKVKRKRAEIPSPAITSAHPGIRSDNMWMQYNAALNPEDSSLQDYWNKPFSVKPELGFYGWNQPQITLRLIDDSLNQDADCCGPFLDFLQDQIKFEKFIGFNSIEVKKGEDVFSMDKGLFYCALVEQFGPQTIPIFAPYVEKFTSSSSEESQQRCAAEMVFGMIKGSRFWSLEPCLNLWTSVLVPCFQRVLSNMTMETLQDWEICLSGATNKHDSNRLRWLFNCLLDHCQLSSNASSSGGGIEGAFSQASCLKLLNKSIVQNWKLKSIFLQTFGFLQGQTSHPYNKVRHQISAILATVLSLDIGYDQDKSNMGNGYPQICELIENSLPKLSLNFHNPVLENGNNHGMEIDENSIMDVEDKESNHALETVALFVTQYIQSTSTSIRAEVYQLLPYFCQFVGNETDQEVSQTCLKSLCYLSVCIASKSSIDFVLEMIWKVSKSSSWKAKMSILEFAQTFVFTNFMTLCLHEKWVAKIQSLMLEMMSDETLQVRQKATKILCGLFHSQFIDNQGQQRLLTEFRNKIRRKMTKKNSGNKFKKQRNLKNLDKAELAAFHSGILGLCALVEAYPYDVPEMIPDVLIELEKHLHDPLPIPKTIKDCFQEFKRTHQDNWQEHKLKFSEEQLSVMTDLLVSPNYYA